MGKIKSTRVFLFLSKDELFFSRTSQSERWAVCAKKMVKNSVLDRLVVCCDTPKYYAQTKNTTTTAEATDKSRALRESNAARVWYIGCQQHPPAPEHVLSATATRDSPMSTSLFTRRIGRGMFPHTQYIRFSKLSLAWIAMLLDFHSRK